MPQTAVTAPDLCDAPVAAAAVRDQPSASRFDRLFGPRVPWNRTTWIALIALALLWAGRTYTTWGAWGDLTVDCGREMYVPALLAAGKTLYRDAYYGYGPAGPYLNSFWFRLFGVNLSVLYWAGSLSALGSAVLLYFAGMELSSWIAGWVAGAVLLMEAFEPSLFSFPLPYSSASVYGCLAACLFLWFMIRAALANRRVWVFAAGMAAAGALLCKLEFGLACYATLALLVAWRSLAARSWSGLARDIAAILPGLAACGAVIAWMISLGGFEFITQENLGATWPYSYFMKTYGKAWLEFSGLTINGPAILQALWQTAVFASAVAACSWMLRRLKNDDGGGVFIMAASFVASLAYLANVLSGYAEAVFRWIFFPQAMVAYVTAAALAAWWAAWRRPAPKPASPAEPGSSSRRAVAVALAFTFSALLALRIFLGMVPAGYPIYYNGPAVLCFLLLARAVVPRIGRSPRLIERAEWLVCGACLAAALSISIRVGAFSDGYVPLTTARGTIRVSPHMAENYRAALAFIGEKAAQGDSVLSVPEDVSLYFLSATRAPARAYFFTPGIVAPGKMEQDAIRQIDRSRTRYVIWSNRTFPEDAAPIFGKDFNQALGGYLTSHYHALGPLLPDDSAGQDWTAVVWERNPAAAGSLP